MPKLVCLDTQILIWGVQERPAEGRSDMVERAKELLSQLNKEKAQIIIPSIVLSEFLLRLEENSQEVVSQLFSRGFQIAPYDTPAAILFTRIWNANVDPFVKAEVFEGVKPTRQELKADICILAIAASRRAEKIYSSDRKHMKRFAQGFISVHDIMQESPFGPLFDLITDENT